MILWLPMNERWDGMDGTEYAMRCDAICWGGRLG